MTLRADGRVMSGSNLRRLRSMVLSGLNATHVPIQLLLILRERLGTGSRASLQILLTYKFYRRKKIETNNAGHNIFREGSRN